MAYTWRSVAAMPAATSTPADPQTANVIELWRSKADALRQTTAYRDFLIKLRREWAIETGVLERLYSLSEGATKTLIEQGLDAALLSHGDTDKPPAEVMALIRDQHAVVEGLYQFIGGERPLSVSYVNELHQALTAHQAAYDAKDPLGRYAPQPRLTEMTFAQSTTVGRLCKPHVPQGTSQTWSCSLLGLNSRSTRRHLCGL